jgi:hypothetical protein
MTGPRRSPNIAPNIQFFWRYGGPAITAWEMAGPLSRAARSLKTCRAANKRAERAMLAGRQRVFAATLGNPNRDNELRHKPFDRSDLAFSNISFHFRPFAPVFGFYQRNDTQNVTRRERLRSASHWKRTAFGLDAIGGLSLSLGSRSSHHPPRNIVETNVTRLAHSDGCEKTRGKRDCCHEPHGAVEPK